MSRWRENKASILETMVTTQRDRNGLLFRQLNARGIFGACSALQQ